MAEKVTPRSKDFSEWYQDIVIQAKLADYSPVKGCMVIRPNGYSIWESIQRELDSRIKKTGARNAYFPVFIPESFLKKEAEHVEGFAPQCAVVTYAGGKELDEKLVIRPTSETIINHMFAKWVQSYRDLPMMVNQWANVVRWEMRTRLFLRTTEFLWQEGHTCHATHEEAEEEAQKILKMYQEFAEDIMAMPVLIGIKSNSEKFAGALRTYSIEAMMQDKKALQAGTSHNLSTNFARAFNTVFLDKDSKQKHVHQTSWGVSTRLIGGLIMTHSDDKGLVLPPRMASTHVVIIPIINNPDSKPKVLAAAKDLADKIVKAGEQAKLPYTVCVNIDEDETKQFGWKLHEHELMGIPVRVEIGPKDLEKNQVVVSRRDAEKKEFVPLPDAAAKIAENLKLMQTELLAKAKKFRDDNTHEVSTYADFQKQIEDKGGFFVTAWCQDAKCEEKVKDETKATIRGLQMDDRFEPIKDKAACMVCGQTKDNVRVVYARSY
jgi:prolyl-tRNA synthetase